MRQSAEELILNNKRLTLITLVKLSERAIKSNELLGPSCARVKRFIICNDGDIATALVGQASSRIVDEDPPHGLRCDCHEVCAVLPGNIALVDQLKIGFVNQRRSIERVAGSLPPQLMLRQAPQLLVNQRQEMIDRLAIAAGDATQQ